MKTYRICIWGTGKRCKSLLLNLPSNCIVEAFIDTLPPSENSMVNPPIVPYSQFVDYYHKVDFVIVAVADHQAIRDFIFRKIGSLENVFFMMDDYAKNFYQPHKLPTSAIVCSLENIFDDKYVNNLRSSFTNDYIVLDVGGVNFLINSRYDVMLNPFLQGETFQQDDIFLYFELMKQYYGLEYEDFKGKYFFDIGANIGSTSIWAKMKICSEMKIVAFEPVEENCRQFYCNLALNSIAPDNGDVIFTHAALSSENGTAEIMHSSCDNFGDCRVIKNGNRDASRTTEQIKTVRLDDWIREEHFSPSEAVCVWMDVQAHEGFVLDGGMKFFSENRLPLMTEIWPNGLRANNSLEFTIERITSLYDKFICIDNYPKDKTVYDVNQLGDFIHNCNLDYFDIFLVK